MTAKSNWIANRPPPADDQPLDAWLKRELGRDFDEALYEKVPDELLELIRTSYPTRH